MCITMRLFVAIATIVNVLGIHSSHTREHFESYVKEYNKTYSDTNETEYRYTVFRENLMIHEFHNEHYSDTFAMGVNQFTDMKEEEFYEYVGKTRNVRDNFERRLTARHKHQRYLVYDHEKSISDNESVFSHQAFLGFRMNVPAEWDWTLRGAVTPVKNQQKCGSCWAFAAIGVLESLFYITTNKLHSFSEQFIVDCNTGLFAEELNQGCKGGSPENTFIYGQHGLNAGVRYEESHPYLGKDGVCNATGSSPLTITGTYMIHAGDNVALKYAVYKNPVVAEIDASSPAFHHYSGGIIADIKFANRTHTDMHYEHCSSKQDHANHAVVIVGYGTQIMEGTPVDYWLVRNSWGPTWGEDGYFKIQRSSNPNEPGVCGIANSCVFPSMKSTIPHIQHENNNVLIKRMFYALCILVMLCICSPMFCCTRSNRSYEIIV
jgi:C1A family cysteine protease